MSTRSGGNLKVSFWPGATNEARGLRGSLAVIVA
jgi:hypothetical protein